MNEINEQAANRALRFLGSLKQSKGRWAGQPLALMDWQQDFIRRLFGTVRPDGRRQYRTAFLFVPRKNGKTELVAGIGNYGLFADGEMGAEVYTAAADRGQASLIYDEASYMVSTAPALARRATVRDSVKRIVAQETASFLQALSAEAYTKHGLGPHMVLFDELHAQPDRGLWDVLTTGSGAREQPLVIAITTAGVDRESICYEIYDYACKVRDGKIEDPTFLPVIYEAAPDDNWEDERTWAKANPALGVFRSIEEMREMYLRAKETPALENTFRQLYLNQWVSSYERWMPMDKWDACGQEPLNMEYLAGRDCYAAFDLSSTTDLTALSLVFPHDGVYDALAYFWIPLDTMMTAAKRDHVAYPAWVQSGLVRATAGSVIDYSAVLITLGELAKTYNIKEVAFDPWNACRLTQDLTEEGFPMVQFSQSVKSMSPPTKELINMVLSKKLRHGGNPVLRWNADNMQVFRDSNGNLKPNKAKATGRIDGMVALIMALGRAIVHDDAGGGPSVYEGRGVLTF